MKQFTPPTDRVIDPTPGERARIDQILSQIRSLDVAITAAQSKRLTLVAELAEIRDAQTERAIAVPDATDVEKGMAYRAMVEEVAAATTVTSWTAERQLHEAVVITETLPRVRERLAEGDLSMDHARVFVTESESLDPDQRARFEEALLTVIEETPLTPAQLRPVAKQLAEKIHPIPLTERHQMRRDGREVTYTPTGDSMCVVKAYLPAVLGVAIRDRLTGMAKEMKSARYGAPSTSSGTDCADETDVWASDTRSIGQIRADIFADLLLAGTPQADPGVTATGLGNV
ncbi:MAG: DUF222 domain-containing protein, partial [Microbacterium sp.]